MSSEVPPDGAYFLGARGLGTFLELTSDTTGTILTTWSFSASESQQWQLTCNSAMLRCNVSNVQYPSMYATLPQDQLGNQYIKSGTQPFEWFVKSISGGYLFSPDPAFINAWNVAGASISNNATVISYPLDSHDSNSIWVLNSTDVFTQTPASADTSATNTGPGAVTAIFPGLSGVTSSPSIVSANSSDPSPSYSNPILSAVGANSSSTTGDTPSLQSLITSVSTDLQETSSTGPAGNYSLFASSSAVPDRNTIGPTAKPSQVNPTILHTSINVGAVAGAAVGIIVTVALVFVILTWRAGWFCFHGRRVSTEPSSSLVTPFPAGYGAASTEAIPHIFPSESLGCANILEHNDMPLSELTQLPPYEVEDRTSWNMFRRLQPDSFLEASRPYFSSSSFV